MRRLLAIVLVAATILTVNVVIIEPADAATPRCHYAADRRVSTGGFADIPVRSRSDNSIACILSNGDRTGAVIVLQHTLNRCYGNRLKVDGIYGRRTMDAVWRAQRASGARADGVYGPETAQRIKHYADNKTCGTI